ncbi:MAG: hypothetical protein NTW07_03155, partial [candidate division Zixibacteria bacterium]|nr:hypothetical protein [candidate division Zixibacteria bacterium]
MLRRSLRERLVNPTYRIYTRQMRTPDHVEGRHLPGTVTYETKQDGRTSPRRAGTRGSALRLLNQLQRQVTAAADRWLQAVVENGPVV